MHNELAISPIVDLLFCTTKGFFMGGHGYESRISGSMSVAQARRLFPDLDPKSIVKWVLVGGAYTVSYKVEINGVTVIRTKTYYLTSKKKSASNTKRK